MRWLRPLIGDENRAHGLVLISFVLLTVAMTYPLAFNLGHRVVGRIVDDAFEAIWFLWWYKHALLDLHTSPLFNPNIFYPAGFDLALSAYPPLSLILVTPLTALLGEVVTYNILLLSTFVISAFGTYLLVFSITRNWISGLFSGLAYAFCSPRRIWLGGGLNILMGSQWIPFVFLCLEKVLSGSREGEYKVKYAVMAGVFFALSSSSSWYFLFIIMLPMLGYVLLRFRPWQRKFLSQGLWKAVLIFCMTTFILVAPSAIPAIDTSRAIESKHPLSVADKGSAGILDFFIPNPLHPLWREWTYSHLRPLHFVYLGFVPSLLGVVALFAKQRNHISKSYGAVALISIVLAMGYFLRFKAKPIALSVPLEMEKLVFSAVNFMAGDQVLPLSSLDGRISIPMPALILYFLLPFFNAMRGLDRFGIMAAFAVAVLAGVEFSKIFKHQLLAKCLVRYAISTLLLLAVLFDLAIVPFAYTTRVEHRAVDVWLAEQEGDFPIIECPLSFTCKGSALYYAITHGKKICHGYATFPPQQFTEARATLSKFPTQKAVDLLRSWGIRYVLVDSLHGDNFASSVAPEIASLDGIRYVRMFNDSNDYVDSVYVYELEYKQAE